MGGYVITKGQTMTTGTHAKRHPPIPWLTYIGILFLGIGLGVVIGLLIAPHDTVTVVAHAGGHVGPHLKPNTGRILAKVPQVKRRTLTAIQVHMYHLRHVRHLMHLHRLHVIHVEHVMHEAAVMHDPRSVADSFGKVIVRKGR